MTPVMLDEDLNQKIQSLNNKQNQIFDMMAFINGLARQLENLLKINQQKYLLKLILCIDFYNWKRRLW